MFEKLVLTNFQPHEKRVVRFDPQVTVFIGDTDAGKTSILRALRWVCLNQPTGDDFINWSADFARATLFLDGGRKVTRQRGKGSNYYKLDDKTFKAFGKGQVPPEIAKLVNVSDVNFQQQLEAHFWFSLTAGQVSKELNAIINLSDIDRVLTNLARTVSSAKSNFKFTTERLQSAQSAYDKLEYVATADTDLKRIERLAGEHDSVSTNADSLAVLVTKAATAVDTLGKAKEYVADGEELLSQWSDLHEMADQYNDLRRLVKNIEEAEVAASTELPDMDDIENVGMAAVAADLKAQVLEDLIEELEIQEKLVWSLENQLAESEKDLASESQGRCPVCGGSLAKSVSSLSGTSSPKKTKKAQR